MRLTKSVIQEILNQNEGFSWNTDYDGKNSSEGRVYTISGGRLHVRASGKTSWADSSYKNEWIADDEETHRHLYACLRKEWIKKRMNLDGIE